MANTRKIALTSGRIATGVVILAVAAATVFAAGRLQLPAFAADVPSVEITPVASKQTRVCSGPLLALSPNGSLGAVGPNESAVAGDQRAVSQPLDSPDDAAGGTFGVPFAVSAPAQESSDRPPVAASQSQSATTSDVAGFAASACGAAKAESWLVGGSTDVGRTSILSLANPTASDATVDIEIYSENGAIDAPGTRGVIVKAGEERLFSLAGFSPNMILPVIRVVASGGQVAASLQLSTITGITPAGVENSGSVEAPDTEQTIAGVVLPATAPEPLGGEGYDDNSPAVRLFAPDKNANVTLEFINETGGENPLPLTVQLTGGAVGEASLVGIPAGSYSVTITSDAPLVAAARSAVRSESGSIDYSWFGASGALDDSVSLAIAPGPGPELHLTNTTDTPRDVVLTAEQGSSTPVTVPPGAATVLPLGESPSYSLTGAEGLHAQVVYQGDGAFSAFGVQPGTEGANAVTVYPRG